METNPELFGFDGFGIGLIWTMNPGLENLDLTDMDTWTGLDKIWIKRKMNPGPETGFKARTKYGIYSCPFLSFLRIENRAKIKRYIFCSGNLDFRAKTLKE